MNSAKSLNQTYGASEIVLQRKKTIEAANICAGESILDIGCGTGFLTFDMAASVTESGHILALDPKPSMVDAARERCAELPQVEIKQGNITSIPATNEQFDLVTCTQVLLYVADIDTALSEIYRVLKPGGRVAIVETDWQGVVINSSFPELTRTIIDAWDTTVASPNLPTRLTGLLLDKNFHSINSEAIALLNNEYLPDTFSANAVKWLPKTAYKRGVISSAQGKLWVEDLEALGTDGNYFFCVNRFLFVAQKWHI